MITNDDRRLDQAIRESEKAELWEGLLTFVLAVFVAGISLVFHAFEVLGFRGVLLVLIGSAMMVAAVLLSLRRWRSP